MKLLRYILTGIAIGLLATPSIATTNWSAWDGVTVGSSTGNVSKMNGVTVGTSSGNYGAWNGLAVAAAGTTVTYGGQNCVFAGGSVNETCAPSMTLSTGQAVYGIASILNTASTLTSVCDGTGTTGCTGSSGYTIEPGYVNGGVITYVFFTCNYVGTGSGAVIITQSEAQGMYGIVANATGNTTTGTACNDGYNKAQSTSAGTALQSGTVTTTNAHDLLVGFMFADSGEDFTAGGDGVSGTYTLQNQTSGVAMIETLAESSTNTYYAAATTGSATWNAMVLALK